jgi:hypothetical protein
MTDASTAIVCNLSEPQSKDRREAFRRDLAPFLAERTYDKDTSRFVFPKSKVSRQKLEHFIALENECCAFLTFELSESATHFSLCVSGPEGSQDLVREFLSAPEKSGCGCSGTSQEKKANAKKYATGFVTLCAIGCAIPPILAATGMIGVATGVYVSNGIEATLIALGLMGVAFYLARFLRKKQGGLPT